ncbi:MAG: hypothetical protein D3915_14420 [Candidatus Electrothrix sp. AU1_5]|nr:hypothetical protein [Candidatus Electrothrix gigas]
MDRKRGSSGDHAFGLGRKSGKNVGQFTPELIEYFLDTHAAPDALIADPFSGSGTVLLESLGRQLDVIGCEVNPAAYAMSKFFEIGAMGMDRKKQLSREVSGVIKSAVFDTLRRSFYIIPILFPVPVCTINSQGEHDPGIFRCPPCTGYFQTLLDNVPMRTLYFA